jgi:poly(3-hydroxybutyrate) depolymerase
MAPAPGGHGDPASERNPDDASEGPLPTPDGPAGPRQPDVGPADRTVAGAADATFTVDPPDAGGPDVGAAPDAAPPTASAGCNSGKAAPAEGAHELPVNGEARKFLLRLPAAYDGKKAWPVLFVFHGAGQSASYFDGNTDLRAQTEAQAILVFPDGPVKPDGRRSWVFRSPDNVLFVDALAAWLKDNTCVDPSRLFATGLSSGGYMSLTLACQRGDVFRAVASASGGMVETSNCRGNPTVWLRIGKADTAGTIASVTMARDFWLGEKTCQRDSQTQTGVAGCQSYPGCRAGASVVFCADPGGHGWPPYLSKAIWTAFAGL